MCSVFGDVIDYMVKVFLFFNKIYDFYCNIGIYNIDLSGYKYLFCNVCLCVCDRLILLKLKNCV